ncbi:nucleotidyltransferase domain-containing protein [Patescibacteria group bacterium]|nr:nucleotidyltransferase domain-containing protein [Patescibacteria group bacterium]MBU1256646.1 nucleotidyltransferase domain-containing protein [Patescibacteria group bacterium]MBU1457772.1 nucleotidyltransferase domain-containing protein [Patescibacteria group bacterium]
MVHQSLLKSTPKKLALKFYQELIKENIPVKKIIMFGSYAKGKQKYYSDLDLCIVSPILGKNNFNERVRLKNIASRVENLIEPHPYHPKDLKEKYDPLAEQIRTTGKILFSTS